MTESQNLINENQEIETDTQDIDANAQQIVIPTTKLRFPKLTNISITEKPINLCDPSATGVMALGIGCLLLAFHDMGITPVSHALTIPWIIFLLGAMQVIPGIIDAFRKNLFGATVFTMYGFFWIANGCGHYLFRHGDEEAMEGGAQHTAMAIFGYFIFNIAPTLAALTLNKALFFAMLFIQITLGIIFFELLGFYGATAAGVGLLFIALTCFYYCLAELVNQIGGGEIIPKGKPFIVIKKKNILENEH
ncbi:inner membrane protein yaah [Anaeramoeba flamelloides]|uniref:Inner membrane protein yaah n=1 Tax=Anaeramoeba flamelloides TaxID=1746091 RepID=A0AAV7YN06_9EUKA|nr:inner membrane protein yaah [Anaeramoeba flamelloides]